MSDQSNLLETALGHHRAGRLDAAAALYREILAAVPQHADALHLLGMVAHAEGDHAGAVELIAKAILIAPATVAYHANIANVYLAIGRSAEAVAHGERAVALDPQNLEAHYNLGNALFAQGDVDAAIDCFDRARRLDPGNIHAQTNYLFAQNFSPRYGRARLYQENLAWGDGLLATVGDAAPVFANPRTAERPLRIGYYLPEPGAHVTPRFLETLLRHHDRAAFEITVYETVGQGGPAPARLREAAPAWRDLTGLDPAAQAAEIRGDRIDILNHTATFKARYRPVLAHRAAPIQIASTNLMATSGLRTVDYVVSDPVIDPPGRSEKFYCERLIRLSRFNAYQPPEDSPAVAPLPVAANGYVTFASFNNVAKVTAATLDAWAAILAGLPTARLVLKHRALDDAAVVDRLSGEFGRRGVALDRVRFEGFTASRRDYLAAYGAVDIGLDPFPFGGGTTSYEALWMGVPVVTVGGDGFMAGQGAGALIQAGAARFVADSPESYVAVALAAADDPDGLAEMRAGLRVALAETAFNGARHVAELEDAYRQVWRDYLQGG